MFLYTDYGQLYNTQGRRGCAARTSGENHSLFYILNIAPFRNSKFQISAAPDGRVVSAPRLRAGCVCHRCYRDEYRAPWLVAVHSHCRPRIIYECMPGRSLLMATNFAAATGAGGPVPLRDPWEGCAGSPWIFFVFSLF